MVKKGIFIIVSILIVLFVVKKQMPPGEIVDPLMYFDEFLANENKLVVEDTRIGTKEPMKIIEDVPYLAYEVAREYISDTIFYDFPENVLTLTNPSEVIRMYEGKTIGERNFEKVTFDYPIKEIESTLYIPIPLLQQKYGMYFNKGMDERIYVIEDGQKEHKVGEVKSHKAYVRTHPQKKSTVVEVLKRGSKITLYKQEGNYIRIRSENGIIGYIPMKQVKNIQMAEPTYTQEITEIPSKYPIEGKVKLVWDQMTVRTTGNWNSTKYTKIKGANVISPTWFEFADGNGTLIDRGTKEYITNARNRGLQVWPLMSHSFTNPDFTKQILQSTEKRQYIIDQLLEKSKEYGYEGVNIDIENIQPETSDLWVQFIRELYPQLKLHGLTVSVDVYMPSDWSMHYKRNEVAKVCDYFIVMAYDQHWSGSENAGPVAALPWVEEGLVKNLEEVPKEKLVLGMPFYTRIWEETAEGVSSKAYGMNAVQGEIEKWGVSTEFDETVGQDYAQINKGDTTYKVWIENKESIQKRIALMKQYNLAGYGCWKLGLETAEIWTELQKID